MQEHCVPLGTIYYTKYTNLLHGGEFLRNKLVLSLDIPDFMEPKGSLPPLFWEKIRNTQLFVEEAKNVLSAFE